jgi:hypothetical protein
LIFANQVMPVAAFTTVAKSAKMPLQFCIATKPTEQCLETPASYGASVSFICTDGPRNE